MSRMLKSTLTRKCDVRDNPKPALLGVYLLHDKRQESCALCFHHCERFIHGCRDSQFTEMTLPGAMAPPVIFQPWFPVFFHKTKL
jgi:hypothetical protein